jgi:hypothetical protein
MMRRLVLGARQFHSTSATWLPRIRHDVIPSQRQPIGEHLIDVINPATGKLIAQVSPPWTEGLDPCE